MMEIVFTLQQMRDVARQLWEQAGKTRVFAFHGEMGAGKTTFIHALCEEKGVRDAVSSPTFSLINEYQYLENGRPFRIFHMDLYRLRDPAEAISAGMEDAIDSGAICLVEWPEKAPGLFPDDTLHCYLSVVDSVSRKLRTERKISYI